jgi:hypothetical protein
MIDGPPLISFAVRPHWRGIVVDTSELVVMSASLSQSLRRRLALWTVRWLIGFGIVAAVTHFWPSASWLWWAAAGVATLSLATLTVMHFVVQRRIHAVQAQAAEANRFAEQIVAAERSGEA